MNSLRIAAWNINGLTGRKDELVAVIASNKLDIVLISESHVTDRSIFDIPGYCIYLTPHPDGGAHGGTAIAIRNNLKHCLLDSYKTPQIQATTVKVHEKTDFITLSAIYCPPRHKIDENMFSKYFKTLGGRFIAGGDWNAKHTFWGSRYTLPRGRELKHCVDINRLLTLSTGEPTYWPSDPKKRPDLLDFFVTKNISNLYTNIESSLDGSSDHSPVILEVSNTVLQISSNHDSLSNYKTDWISFRDYLNNNINLKIPLQNTNDINNATEYITNLIQVAAWINTPSLNPKKHGIYLPLDIRSKIQEKRRLRRIWQNSHCPDDKACLNRAIKELKRILEITANNTIKDKLEKLSPTGNGERSLWKATKSLKQPQQQVPPIRTGLTWARTDAEKAEAFAAHLRTVFQPNDSPDPDDPEIQDVLNQDLQMCLPLKPTSPKEISSSIDSFDSKKAPGFDLITPRILKELPKKCITFLAILFNRMFQKNHFPDIWKVSQVIMIPKPGKPNEEATSYRPISLTPILSKVWELIFLNRLKNALDDSGIIPGHQFGFRKQHSTTEQVHRVYHTIRQCLEKKEYCSAAFLDVQQAFDRVWHRGLLVKIKKYLPHSMFLLLESYLDNRIFQVKYGEARSSLYTCFAGVPQGTVLGPVLYNIFTCDVPLSSDVTIATFADDAAFLSCNKNAYLASSRLQEHLNKTHTWLNKWRMKASASKSQHITFTLRKGDCPSVKLGNEDLPTTDNVKYLGFYLDRRLTWKYHINHKRDALNARFRNLLWLLGRQSTLSLNNKLLVYCTILKPIWLYGIQLWGTSCKTSIMRIQRVQNNILRTITGAPWFTRNDEIHQYVEMPTIREEIDKYSKKHKSRLAKHPNSLAKSLLLAPRVKRLKRADVLDNW